MRLIARTGFLLALSLTLAACVWAQTVPPDCKAAFDAEDKMMATPHHSFSNHTVGGPQGKATISEGIFANGTFYILYKGEWRKSPLTLDEMRKQQAENRKDVRNLSCKLVKEESVEGSAVRVYQSHYENDNGKYDATSWISKSSGLPLKQEEDIDMGGGEAKSHVSIRYEYSNVSAPAVH